MAQWSPGDEITSDKLNENRGFANTAARAYRITSGQSIPDGTWTKAEFNAESYDEGGNYDHVTNYKYTAPTTGIYLIKAEVLWDSIIDEQEIAMAIKKNGGEPHLIHSIKAAPRGGDLSQEISIVVKLDATDYVEIHVWQGAGVNKDIKLGENSSYMEVIRLA